MTITPDGEIIGVFCRTPYNYDTDAESNRTGLACSDPSKTQQNFKDEADINNIVERFLAAGEMPQQTPFPQQDEFMETFDFQTSMNVLVQAERSFMELPAKVRARFQNDPQQFMEFMHDPENIPEMEKLKLVTIRKEPKTPEPTPTATPKETPKE